MANTKGARRNRASAARCSLSTKAFLAFAAQASRPHPRRGGAIPSYQTRFPAEPPGTTEPYMRTQTPRVKGIIHTEQVLRATVEHRTRKRERPPTHRRPAALLSAQSKDPPKFC